MLRITRALATAGLAGLALGGVASTASAVQPVNPEEHKASYWEALYPGYSCDKVEYRDGVHSAEVPENGFIVVKAGTAVTQVWSGGYGYYSEKDISFVITCIGPQYS